MKTFVKICGLANASDLAATVAAGPDAVGFVFWPGSPRAVSAEQVSEWWADLDPGPIQKVGVFVDASPAEVARVVEVAGLDVAQLHGSESPAAFAGNGYAVWKVLHVDRLPEGWREWPVERFLVDHRTEGMPGGTGVRVDEARAAALVGESPRPVLLAGGLNAGNVASAIRAVRPAGVDVSSGVERAPGIKHMDDVRRFIEAARSIEL